MKAIKLFVVSATLCTVFGSCLAAQTPSPPAGSIRIVTVGPPGGSMDLIARTIAQGFQGGTGQTAIVDNKPGASGNIAVTEVARSKPDGSTIGIITNGTHGVNAALFGKNLPYDPVKDFTPVSSLLELKFVLVVNPTFPAESLKEFVTYVKSNPNKVSFGSAGAGSAPHMAAELFLEVANLKMTHVAYPGTARALSMVMSNEVQAMFVPIAESLEHIQGGRVRALAVSSKERSGLLPDLASISELSYPAYDFKAWIGMAGPSGLSEDVVRRYNEAIRGILSKPDVRERLKGVGMEIKTSSADELAALIRAEVAKWPPIVKAAGISVH